MAKPAHGLIAEIHRHTAWQVFLGYLGVSWGVLEAADLFAEQFGLPDWLFRLTLGVLTLGLVLLIALAIIPAFRSTAGEASDGEGDEVKGRLAFGWKAAGILVVFSIAMWGLIASVLLASRNRAYQTVMEFAGLIPEIEALAEVGHWDQAYELAAKFLGSEAEQVPGESFWLLFSAPLRIDSDPPGAVVLRKPYAGLEAPWDTLGATPVRVERFPRGCSRLRFTRPGYRDLEVASPCSSSGSVPERIEVRLTEDGDDDVVFVPGGEAAVSDDPELEMNPPIPLGGYWIDRFEVTNQQFKVFVDSGCYQDPACWRQSFLKNGKTVPWTEAVTDFVDATGRPGPSTWNVGDFPRGQADFPVTGVSWYEAMAYADFVGRDLPSAYHWAMAVRLQELSGFIVPLSNLDGAGPTAVGTHRGVSHVGAYDLIGNAREWVQNESDGLRFAMGGDWDAAKHSFGEFRTPPFDRSESLGFRLITVGPDSAGLTESRRSLRWAFRDYTAENPVSDDVFEIYRGQFSYDRGPLEASVEAVDTSDYWIRERISFNAAYGSERMTLYLFIPRNGEGPFQTVVKFPGSMAIRVANIDDFQQQRFDFIVKSGRALAFPVYKSTFERRDGMTYTTQDESGFYRDHVIMWGKDLSRSIDYLETRNDIDSDGFGFFGHSWGGRLGGIMLAIEPRLTVGALYVAGFNHVRTQPEVDPLNYVPRVTVPVMMLNGEYDAVFPLETSAKPMFDLLGTSTEQKRHVIALGGHAVPRNQLISSVLDWLDLYMGPVGH